MKKHYADPRSKEYLIDDIKEQKLYTEIFAKVKITKGDGSEVYKDFPVDRLKFNKNKQNADEDEDKNVPEDMKKILD